MSLLLMFRYYRRLLKIESENKEVNSLLRSTFIEDKSLQKSWNKTMLNNKQKMNISSLDISNTEFSIHVRHFFENKLTNQIENTRKLILANFVFTVIFLPNFNCKTIQLHFLIAKEKRSLLTESVHILLLLKLVDTMGRYVKIVFVNSVPH